MPSIKKTSLVDHPLRAWRIQRGLSQDQLAVLVKTSKPTVSRIEAGLLDPSFDLLRRVIVGTRRDRTIIGWVRQVMIEKASAPENISRAEVEALLAAPPPRSRAAI